jgi:hypothetical protein
MSKRLCGMAVLASLALAGAAWAAAPEFDDVDANQDGMLSKIEASVVKGLDFAKADLDKDGMLDRAEYDAATS